MTTTCCRRCRECPLHGHVPCRSLLVTQSGVVECHTVAVLGPHCASPLASLRRFPGDSPRQPPEIPLASHASWRVSRVASQPAHTPRTRLPLHKAREWQRGGQHATHPARTRLGPCTPPVGPRLQPHASVARLPRERLPAFERPRARRRRRCSEQPSCPPLPLTDPCAHGCRPSRPPSPPFGRQPPDES